MEDFRIELVTGTGAGARAIPLPIERFTLVGATTRTGQLGSPLLSRFGIVETFAFYSAEELTTIVRRSARLLGHPHRRRRRRGDWPPRARDAPHRQPAAAPHPRLRRRARRRPRHPRRRPSTRWAAWRSTRRASTPAIAGAVDDRQAVRRGPGGDRLAGGLAGRRSRHAGVRLRALPDSGGIPDPHAARPPNHPPRLRAPGGALARSRPGEIF